MADFHPEVEKEIEAGPQSICDQHIPVMRNESLEEGSEAAKSGNTPTIPPTALLRA